MKVILKKEVIYGQQRGGYTQRGVHSERALGGKLRGGRYRGPTRRYIEEMKTEVGHGEVSLPTDRNSRAAKQRSTLTGWMPGGGLGASQGLCLGRR